MNSDVCIDPVARLKQLNQRASDFICDHKIPVMRYLRSSKEMERMALVYAEENEYENCFLLYMKLITLLVEKLPKHPQYKSASPDEKKTANKRCKCALQAAEKVKSLLKDKFEKEYNKWLLKEEERKKQEQAEIQRNEQIKKQEELRKEEERRKQEELRKNAEQLKAASSLPASAPFVSSVPASVGVSSNDAGTHLESLNDAEAFPSVPTVSDIRSQPTAPVPDNAPPLSFNQSSYSSQNIPQQPPSYVHFAPGDIPTQPPPYQDISPSYQSTSPSYQSTSPSYQSTSPPYQDLSNGLYAEVPKFDRSSKPSHFTKPEINRSTKPEETFRQDSSLDGNRQVVIPPDLVPRFLQLAYNNTLKNLETCGILTGKLARNSFRITHLVIPKQTATPDSCTTESEEDLFDVQDKHDLITLGWIHTHPSQTSFLSSVDLHTQCSYQQLMPEAIAIVCSPKYQTIGMYRLTPSYGVNYISSCTKSGFHPHPKEPPLYEESPLVSVDNSLKVEIIDLR